LEKSAVGIVAVGTVNIAGVFTSAGKRALIRHTAIADCFSGH